MKTKIFLLTLMLLNTYVYADTLTLAKCVEAARFTSGIHGFGNDFNRMAELERQLSSTYKLPDITINGQYTYQSDVVSFPEGPFQGPEIPKGQGRTWLEVQQVIYNGNRTEMGGEMAAINVEITRNEWEAELKSTDDQVTELFFSIILSRRQENLHHELLEELRRQRKQLERWTEQGIKSAIDLYRFDLMVARQEGDLLDALSRKRELEGMLSELTALDIEKATLIAADVVFPAMPEKWQTNALQALELRKSQLDLSDKMQRSYRLPVVTAFVQAGVGQPNPFNFFDTNVSGYYMVGVRGSWRIFDWGRTGSELERNEIKKEQLDKKAALIGDRLQARYDQMQTRFEQTNERIALNQKEKELQEKVLELSERQFEEGIITSAQYLDEIAKAQVASIRLEMYRIQQQKNIWETIQLIENNEY